MRSPVKRWLCDLTSCQPTAPGAAILYRTLYRPQRTQRDLRAPKRLQNGASVANCASSGRPSKPVQRCKPTLGRFDSCAAPLRSITEQQIRELRETPAWLCDNYGAEYSLLALSGYASARTGKHFEAVELAPLTEAEKAEIETLAALEILQRASSSATSSSAPFEPTRQSGRRRTGYDPGAVRISLRGAPAVAQAATAAERP